MSKEEEKTPAERFLEQYTIPPDVEQASHEIIGAAIEVHRLLGPGLLESLYHTALAHELSLRNITFRQEVPVTISYKDIEIEGQRLDLWVDPGVVVELKAVDRILPIHEAQLLSYLKTTGCRLGLLINFKVKLLEDGIKRMAN